MDCYKINKTMKKNIIESKSKLTPDDLNILRHLESEQKVSQRDLSNSTISRNFGTAFGYTMIAYDNLVTGLSKLLILSCCISTKSSADLPL